MAEFVEFLKRLAEVASYVLAIGSGVGFVAALVLKPWRKVITTMKQVETMSKALGENGGASLADEIRRQGRVQKSQGTVLHKAVLSLEAMCDVIEKAIFQTDDAGHWVRVNSTFTYLLGHPSDLVLGMGWVSVIHPDDRESFMEDWSYAVKDRRSFRRRVRLLTNQQQMLSVLVHAHALGVADQHVGWSGTIEIDRGGASA